MESLSFLKIFFRLSNFQADRLTFTSKVRYHISPVNGGMYEESVEQVRSGRGRGYWSNILV